MLWLDLGEYRGPGHFHAFVMYAVARRRRRNAETAYRVYVTDTMRMTPQGMVPAQRYADMLHAKAEREMGVDEIVDHVLSMME